MAPTQSPRYVCRLLGSILKTATSFLGHHISATFELRAGVVKAESPRHGSKRSEEAPRQSHSAHHTEQVTVHYRWHPLHGKTICGAAKRASRPRGLALRAGSRTAAIPVWMTDRAACAAPPTGPVLVSVEALTESRRW